MFWHRPTNILNSLAHFLADCMVCVDGLLLSFNAFDSNLLFCLRYAKFIGREFGTTNTIKQVLFFSDPLMFLDVSCTNAAIEPFIACILKNTEHAASNASGFCHSAKLAIRILYSFTKQEATFIFCESFLILLSVSLLYEISLSRRNFWLCSIAVHRDQVAGILAEGKVFSFPHTPFTNLDHLGHWHEMMCNEVPCILARHLCPFNYFTKVPPILVIEDPHYVPRHPIRLVILRALFKSFKPFNDIVCSVWHVHASPASID